MFARRYRPVAVAVLSTAAVIATPVALAAAAPSGAATPKSAPVSKTAAPEPRTTTTSASKPTPTTVTGAAKVVYKVVDVASRSTLNVRTGPGLNGKVIGRLSAGAIVTATGATAKSGSVTWREIAFGSRTGWVSGAYLAKASS